MATLNSLFRELGERPDGAQTLAVLQEIAQRELGGRDLLRFHDSILFYKAYPRSAEMRKFCERELNGFYARARSLSDDERELLDQSGVVGSRLYYGYDDATARWLVSKQQGQIDIHWDEYEDRDSDPLSAFLPVFLSPAEQDAVDDSNLSTREVIEAAKGESNSLEWVLGRFAACYAPEARADLYDPLQLPLELELIPEGPSRTLVDDGQPEELFIWDPVAAKAKIDLTTEVLRPLALPDPLPKKKGEYYLDLAHAILLVRLRELYPLTHGNPEEVYDIPLERGSRVVWWFMRPRSRLPMEAGWACLLFKNNVPIGYGAGGILHHRNEISINVFDTFRGGEAAWLYAQYARICHSLCPAPWLVTRKWQLGGDGNEEGIAAGSYWFYDKLGFRSTDAALRKIADQERRLIAKTPGYRTPKRVLRKLAEADVVFSLEGKSPSEYREYPLGHAGLLTAQLIANRYGGDREQLTHKILQDLHRAFGIEHARWSAEEKHRAALFGLLAFAIPSFSTWNQAERAAAAELWKLKGSHREADYARAIRHALKFFHTIAAARAPKSV